MCTHTGRASSLAQDDLCSEEMRTMPRNLIRMLLIMHAAVNYTLIPGWNLAVLWIMNEKQTSFRDREVVQSGENIRTIVYLRKTWAEYGDTKCEKKKHEEVLTQTLRDFLFSSPFISRSTWRRCLPGEARMQPGLSVRPFVRLTVRRATQPETGSAAFCPAAHKQWDPREIPGRTWARSNHEVFYRTSEIANIHFSGWKPTNWNVTFSCISSAAPCLEIRVATSSLPSKNMRRNRKT